MKRLSLRLSFAASTAAVAAIVACGGISDPTKGSSEHVATVSGALTGTNVPANTRVALVWKVGASGGYAVSDDVAVVNGQFTMALSAPPDNYFTPAESSYDGLSGGSTSVPPTTSIAPPSAGSGGTSTSGSPGSSGGASTSGSPGSSGGASTSGSPGSTSSGGGMDFAFGGQLGPRDNVSGQITKPLNAAVAGFVVYVDSNNNGKLDLEGKYAASTDNVIGGNKELILAYLRDGGALDYEKLRDRSSILPHAGYNLAWDEGRWFPLNAVELKISDKTKLPNAVCSGSGASDGNNTSADVSASTTTAPSSGSSSGSGGSTGGSGYPQPGDPRLHCSVDGYSWTYDPNPSDCQTAPPPPAPVGLCASSFITTPTARACGGIASSSFKPGSDLPPGWPCAVNGGADGGIITTSADGGSSGIMPKPDSGT